MRRRRPPAPPGQLPPPPGGRDPPPLDRCADGRRRCDGSGEYGDHDDVNACDRHRCVVHWAGGLRGRRRLRRRGGGWRRHRRGSRGGTRYAHDFLEVILCRLWEGRFGKWRTTTKTTETSRDRQQAQRRRHDTFNVRNALRGQAIAVVVVQGSPEAPIAGDDRGEGGRGGSVTDETITDGARTAATTERGMRR